MSNCPPDLLDLDLCLLQIIKILKSSEASSIFEVKLNENHYAMKVYHNNGDPGYTPKGRDLNRFRCELNAYRNLSRFGVCERGLVPYYHGYIAKLDTARFQPHLSHFADDKHNPSAILLEYLPNAEELNCVNYSDERFQKAIDGLKAIHAAHIHHYDLYPRNILLVRGSPERVVWIDFDVAMIFPNKATVGSPNEYCKYECDLVASLGELLREDQRQGLPPNTKYY